MRALKKGTVQIEPGESYGTPKEIWGFRTAAQKTRPERFAKEFLSVNAPMLRIDSTILHEFGHAIQDAIVPDFGQSEEAAAMGEGFGDYFAASFFADKKPEHYRTSVMTWDGLLIGLNENRNPPCLRHVNNSWTNREMTSLVRVGPCDARRRMDTGRRRQFSARFPRQICDRCVQQVIKREPPGGPEPPLPPSPLCAKGVCHADETRIYFGRAFGCDRHHRHVGHLVAAGSSSSS